MVNSDSAHTKADSSALFILCSSAGYYTIPHASHNLQILHEACPYLSHNYKSLYRRVDIEFS